MYFSQRQFKIIFRRDVQFLIIDNEDLQAAVLPTGIMGSGGKHGVGHEHAIRGNPEATFETEIVPIFTGTIAIRGSVQQAIREDASIRGALGVIDRNERRVDDLNGGIACSTVANQRLPDGFFDPPEIVPLAHSVVNITRLPMILRSFRNIQTFKIVATRDLHTWHCTTSKILN